MDFPFFFNELSQTPTRQPLNDQKSPVTKNSFGNASLRSGSGEIPTFL